ncbi:ferrous iron transport protein A [Proteiniborus ethanoligenes]|uniref:Ferrous iron transport protein A n=1 Tax=Proteiniborus ethanoligenes TaxID=415015 RepID=A0A1H3Q1E9_9FIRM|nr:FeoA domain-containing protein [Proteiniborus ethanoligenes]TAH64115.1 MAG: ferrous iron transport protein A [Gottschalkiaceae bacterium]SDZ06549.1 ferrous iron transport protein A [Proteiniborus ethanoligenes]
MTSRPLSFFMEGEIGMVDNIAGGEKVSKRLYEMGFNTGSEVKVIKNDIGPIIVSLAGSKIALGRGLAQKIMIRAN